MQGKARNIVESGGRSKATMGMKSQTEELSFFLPVAESLSKCFKQASEHG